MEWKRILTVCTVVGCAWGKVPEPENADRVGLDRPTDQPIQASDYDLSVLLGNAFPGSSVGGEGVVDPSTTVATPVDSGRGPEQDNPVDQQGSSYGDEEPQGDCECVPYYQCNTNRTVIENGEGLIDVRMKSGPCDDYLDVCCKTGDKLTPDNPITPSPPPVPASDTCGKRNFGGVSSLRITGAVDNEAQFGEFPWVVAVIRKDTANADLTLNVFQCGGSLIHPQVVLTAAHCVKGKTGLSVRVGEWDTQRKSEPLPTQTRTVKQVVIHEEFYAGALFNDIALLFLESAVDIADNVATVCLPEQGESMDQRTCVASGWGKDVFGKEGKYQVILKKVELPTVAREPCLEALRKTRLGRHFKLHKSFICAGGIPGKDTCKGDGGGPLACPTPDNPSIYVQAGIVAWGIGCGTETPGVYVDVAQFRNWIDNKTSMLNIDIRDLNKSKQAS